MSNRNLWRSQSLIVARMLCPYEFIVLGSIAPFCQRSIAQGRETGFLTTILAKSGQIELKNRFLWCARQS
ncbi:MAG: hypothetical protein HC849_22665 [Oscillatoriales cyanobacterium RU_3_3]|nr:hypothetical protein [Oscillatoriales cyanobacterium RU_3_3]